MDALWRTQHSVGAASRAFILRSNLASDRYTEHENKKPWHPDVLWLWCAFSQAPPPQGVWI